MLLRLQRAPPFPRSPQVVGGGVFLAGTCHPAHLLASSRGNASVSFVISVRAYPPLPDTPPGGGQQVRWMTGASKEPPPPTTLGAPRERGCPLQPQKRDRSCRTSSTLQHHWLGQLGTQHDDDEAFRRGEHMGRVGFDSRIFFPWMAGHPCLTLRARSLSFQGDPANIGKG